MTADEHALRQVVALLVLTNSSLDSRVDCSDVIDWEHWEAKQEWFRNLAERQEMPC